MLMRTHAIHPETLTPQVSREQCLPLAKAIVKLENAVEERTRRWYCGDNDRPDQNWDQASAEVRAAQTALVDIVTKMLIKVAENAAAARANGAVAMTVKELLADHPAV